MKKKKTVRVLVGMLILLMVFTTAFSGCKDETDLPDDTDNGERLLYLDGGDNQKDKNGLVYDSLGELGLNYSGDSVKILYWEDVEMPEFDVEMDGTLVSEAIYTRNDHVQERLNVFLDWVPTPGRNQSEYLTKVQNDQYGSQEYDIYAAYSQTIGSVTAGGFTLNLKDVYNMDWNAPWWPDSLNNSSLINGKLYFCSGDISTNALYFMYATFFNKAMYADYGLDDKYGDLYDLVDSGNWTLDTFIEMCTDISIDALPDGKGSEDTYGTVIPWLSVDAFFYSSGLLTVEHDDDGSLIISPSYIGEKAQNLCEKLVAFFGSDGAAYSGGTDSTPGNFKGGDRDVPGGMFNNGQMVFYTNRTKDAIQYFGGDGLAFGVVPTPKYDTAQKTYLTAMANGITLYSIASTRKGSWDRMDELGAVLECLASEGYRHTTPAIFEITLKLRYASDNITSRMYDMIRENLVFDVGRVFGNETGNYTQTTFRNFVGDACLSGATGWISETAQFTKTLAFYLEDLTDRLN